METERTTPRVGMPYSATRSPNDTIDVVTTEGAAERRERSGGVMRGETPRHGADLNAFRDWRVCGEMRVSSAGRIGKDQQKESAMLFDAFWSRNLSKIFMENTQPSSTKNY